MLMLLLLGCPAPDKNTDSTNRDVEEQDADNDGVSAELDCNDDDPAIFPGAAEVCNGQDDDCDGTDDEDATDATTWFADADNDGFGDTATTTTACDAPDGYGADSADCDDANPAVFPGAAEQCNGQDDDCDGTTDEDAIDTPTWYADTDRDGFGDPANTIVTCDAPDGYGADSADCDDGNPAVFPGAAEQCNGQDDDCDGTTDEDAIDAPTWYADTDRDGFGDSSSTITACDAPVGYGADSADCDDGNPAVFPGAAEQCNDQDDDCDGTTDEDAIDALLWYADADVDGFGDSSSTITACDAPVGYGADSADCDDGNPAVFPGAAEQCNDQDDDCDGTADEDAIDMTSWFADTDSDGFGDPTNIIIACDEPVGYGADSADCDDGNPAVFPGAAEQCNDQDDDCDGTADEDAIDASIWYADTDSDGFGDPTNVMTTCDAPDGYGSDSTDCNDADPEVFPGADPQCGDVDQDCDGLIDSYLGVPRDYGTIQSAINAASDGALICVSAGTYTENLSVTGRQVRVESVDGPEVTIIDGGGTDAVVSYDNTADGSLVGFTLQNGACHRYTYYGADFGGGGGVYLRRSDVRLEDLLIDGATCDADYAYGATLYLENFAGTLYNVTVTNSTVQTTATLGALAYVVSDGAEVDGLTLQGATVEVNNVNTEVRGMLYVAGDYTLQDVIVDDVALTVDADYATGVGFLVYLEGENLDVNGLSITNSTIQVGTNNSAGLILYGGASNIDLRNLNISGNSVSSTERFGFTGGLVMLSASVIDFSELTISNNTLAADASTSASGAGALLSVSGLSTSGSGLYVQDNQAAVGWAYVYEDPAAVVFPYEATLSDVVISGNEISYAAGDPWGTLALPSGGSLVRAVIADNMVSSSATTYSGGLYVSGETTIENVVMSGNVSEGATTLSGGMYGADNVSLSQPYTLTNVDVVANASLGSAGYGGGIGLADGLVLNNVSMASNTATSNLGTAIYGVVRTLILTSTWSNYYDHAGAPFYEFMAEPDAADGNLFVDPGYTDTTASTTLDWDLSLSSASALRDMGDPTVFDTDGSRSDMGSQGGPNAWSD